MTEGESRYSAPHAAASAHLDTFARDNLPPRELWPVMDYTVLPALTDYPSTMNCAVSLVDERVEAGDGGRIAIRWPGGRWTYDELLDRTNRIAHALTDSLGLVPGNRVLLRAPNTPMMAACWFGVVKAGGICVATMPLLRTRELATIANRAKIALALTDVRLAADLEAAKAAAPTLETVVGFSADGTGGGGVLETMMAGRPDTFDGVQTAADDVAMIAFTSGTTGQPKGTMHFHRDVLASCDCFPPHVLRADPDDVFCGSPPLAFTFGLGGLLLFPLRIGASTLLLENASPPNLLDGMARERATVCFTAPTAYRAMAADARVRELGSLRKCVSAGETLPAATFETWEAATGVRIIDGIGSTELLHIFISSPEDECRPGSTGRVVPGYTAKLIDEDGKDVPTGGIGRLAVRGPTGCRYLDDVERQKTYVQDGWNLTGDAYRMDEDGYFRYQARADDMIISSGYNIAGPEVENVLLEHECVQECGVVGVPDEERGHIVAAFIVLRPGYEPGRERVEELQAFVKASIAPYKYPRRIDFVNELPRTNTGKLQRFRLRENV
jgi:2-aminobenzoate-CoA ligase